MFARHDWQDKPRASLLRYVDRMCLAINPRSDGYGWLLGSYETADGEPVHVDIMPPKHAWNGDARWPGFEPHETDWVIYIDGDEAGRVSAYDEIEQTIRWAISGSSP